MLQHKYGSRRTQAFNLAGVAINAREGKETLRTTWRFRVLLTPVEPP